MCWVEKPLAPLHKFRRSGLAFASLSRSCIGQSKLTSRFWPQEWRVTDTFCSVTEYIRCDADQHGCVLFHPLRVFVSTRTRPHLRPSAPAKASTSNAIEFCFSIG